MPHSDDSTTEIRTISATGSEDSSRQASVWKNAWKNDFVTNYNDMLDGSASFKWQQHQLAALPQHRITHIYPGPGILCTCGAGPFNDQRQAMQDWCNHAAGREIELGAERQAIGASDDDK